MSMKNKIIFCTVAAILALIMEPIIGFVNEAKDCKFELENFKQAELNNKKIISTQMVRDWHKQRSIFQLQFLLKNQTQIVLLRRQL